TLFFFSSRRRHTRFSRDWSSDVCSSDLAIQDSLPYMEPPYWYYPVRQSLGAVLLRMGDAPGAARVFEETLARVPNNGWALYGLQQTYRQLENLERLARVTRRLEEAWFADLAELDLKRL